MFIYTIFYIKVEERVKTKRQIGIFFSKTGLFLSCKWAACNPHRKIKLPTHMELEGMMVHRLQPSVSKIEAWWYFISCTSLVLCVMLGTQWCCKEPFSAPSCRKTDRTGFCCLAQEAKQILV